MIILRTLDIMELNTTMQYERENVADNKDVHVLASNYLAYKIGKLYSSQNFLMSYQFV